MTIWTGSRDAYEPLRTTEWRPRGAIVLPHSGGEQVTVTNNLNY